MSTFRSSSRIAVYRRGEAPARRSSRQGFWRDPLIAAHGLPVSRRESAIAITGLERGNFARKGFPTPGMAAWGLTDSQTKLMPSVCSGGRSLKRWQGEVALDKTQSGYTLPETMTLEPRLRCISSRPAVVQPGLDQDKGGRAGLAESGAMGEEKLAAQQQRIGTKFALARRRRRADRME